MEQYCKNCGAKIDKDQAYCPDCGTKIKKKIICRNCNAEINESSEFCPNCGHPTKRKTCPKCNALLDGGEDFCGQCGANLNSSKNKFIEKYKKELTIGAILIAAVIVLAIAFSMMSYNDLSNYEFPPQTVTVGAHYFEIPGDFISDPDSFSIETKGYSTLFSQTWTRNGEHISIGIVTGYYNVDLDSIVPTLGGKPKNLMGRDGYYDENDINSYMFSFVLGNDICIIETSSPYLYDEIAIK